MGDYASVHTSDGSNKKQNRLSIIFVITNSGGWTLQTTKQNYHGAQGSECFLVLSNNMAGSGGRLCEYSCIRSHWADAELMHSWGIIQDTFPQCSSSSDYDFILFAQSQLLVSDFSLNGHIFQASDLYVGLSRILRWCRQKNYSGQVCRPVHQFTEQNTSMSDSLMFA